MMKKLTLALATLFALAILVGCGASDDNARKAAVEGDGYSQGSTEDRTGGSGGAGGGAQTPPPGSISNDGQETDSMDTD